MKGSVWVAAFAGIALAGVAGQAAAQYYEPPPPPPPGYYPSPPPPGYYPPPPRRYALGGRCRARLPTAYGPEREFCVLARPRPLGEPCRCPPPPNYPPGAWPRGRVIP